MTRRSTRLAGLAVVAVVGATAIFAWSRRSSTATVHARAAIAPSSAAIAHAMLGTIGAVARRVTGTVIVSGTVVDELDRSRVGGVEIVLRGASGDATTVAHADGTYAIAVTPGEYRAFVRDDKVMSVGLPDHVRLDTGPHADAANVPDLSLMPLVTANADTPNVELGVTHGGIVTGRVVDGDGLAVAHAIVRARGDTLRPALGTDIAEANEAGGFELRLSPGRYQLDASQPKFAGSEPHEALVVRPGVKIETIVTLAAGCVVTGHAVRADGTPANDGAIERAGPNGSFGPAGRVEPDGTFRWTSFEAADVTLRAWPWKSPPSEPHQFHCVDGARYDAVLKLPSRRPDIDGVLVDATGAPVPLGYIDVKPLDPFVIGQQERADSNGRWEIFDMPPGSYELTATAPGRGIAVMTIAAPREDVRLQLGGTGRIAGTTTGIADGSFEASFIACSDAIDANNKPLLVARETRIVTVTGGRFTIDGAPACHLLFAARWRTKTLSIPIVVTTGDTAHVELDLGPPHDKTIHGVVRDQRGEPVANARITAIFEGQAPATASTDATGAYAMRTVAGASLIVGDGDHVGSGVVGRANVADEQIDLVLGAAVP